MPTPTFPSRRSLILHRHQGTNRCAGRSGEQPRSQMQRSASQVHGLRVGTDVPHPRSHGTPGRVRSEEPTAWAAGTLALPTAHEAKAGRSVDRGKGARDWGCSTRNVDSTAKGQLARYVCEALIGHLSRRLRRTARLNA